MYMLGSQERDHWVSLVIKNISGRKKIITGGPFFLFFSLLYIIGSYVML